MEDYAKKYKRFKIGDRVRIINGWHDFHCFKDEKGTITKIKNNYRGIVVKFDILRVYPAHRFLGLRVGKSTMKTFSFDSDELVKQQTKGGIDGK